MTACVHDRTTAADARGFSLLELVIALAVVSLMACLAVPGTSQSLDAGRGRQAAGFVATRFQLARHRALFTSRVVSLVFDLVGDRWTFRVCEDGNGNGLRRTDVAAGVDPCLEGPYDIADMFTGMRVLVDPLLPGPDGEPGSADAVRFGRSDIVSFDPSGSASAGTVFLRSVKGRQYAIRLSNVTGRTRVLRYDTGARTWIAA